MTLDEHPTEAAAVAALTLEAEKGVVRFTAAGNREFVALPTNDGYRLEQITQTNGADVLMPKLVTANVKVQTAGSLCDYINRFKNFDTALFADIATDTIVSIIDYHKMPGANMLGNPNVPTSVGMPSDYDAHAQLNLHRATLKLPRSLEWDIWNKADGMMMKHVAFASFIEENAIDITDPSGAALLEMCRDLQIKGNVNFKSSIRFGDTVSIDYQKDEDVSTKDSMQLPSQITLSIPVYFGEPPVQVTAYLRREINEGKLSLGYKLSRAEAVRQAEFHRIVNEVMASVELLPTFYGTPA